MKVLLVSTYELGRQPLGVATAAAALAGAGHEVRARDLAVEPVEDAALRWADTVAVSVPMHTAMRLAVPLAERVRALRGDTVGIVLFGLYAPLCADALADGLVDAAVGGEVEDELVSLVGGAPPGRRVVLDRISVPLPRRQVLPPLRRYAPLVEPDGGTRLAAAVELTRGCVHRCRHCPVPAVYDGRIRVVAVDTVVEDAVRLHAMGARHLTLADADALNAPRHLLRGLRAIHARLPEVTLDITTKVEHVLEHRMLWPELRDLGVVLVTSAVESVDDEVLRILDKGHTHADAREAVAVLSAAGVALRPTLLPFTPWSDLSSLLHLVDFVDRSGLREATDPVQLTIRLLVPRGSLLLGHPSMTAHLDGYDPATFCHRWQHPDPAMDALQSRLAALVGAATDAGEAAAVTHAAIRAELGATAAARGLAWGPAPEPAGAVAGPRVVEPWFC